MNLQKQTYFSVSSSRAPIRNTADYSPFGIQLDGRTLSYVPPAPAPPSVTIVYQHKFDDNPITHPYTTAPNQLNTKLTNVSWTNSQSSWTNFAGFTSKAIATNSATQDTTRLYLNLTVNSGFMLDVKSYSFYHRSSTTGYTNYQLLVNGVLVGSGSIFVSSGSTLQSTGTINVANAIAGLTGSVTITLKLFVGSNGNNATFRLDDFTLNGYTQEVQVYAESYRYGFNKMEADNEIKGQGNSYDFGARMYDSRVGRWWSMDALAEKQPEQSTYKAFLNNPLVFVDPNGKTEYETIVVYDPNGNLLFKAHRKISDNLMSGGDLDDEDGVRISGGYDYRHYTEIRMQNDGQIKVTAYQRTEILTQNGLKDKEYIFAFKNKGEIYSTNISSYIPFIPEGDGGTQNGGWKLTVPGGGASPTKQKALYHVEEIEIGDFLTSWGAMKVGSFGSKPVDALKNIAEIWTMFAPKIEKKDSKKEERNVKVFERQFNSDGSFSLIEYKEKMTKENADKFHGKYNKTGDTTTYDKY